ncbi:MAG TPA: STAS domain-containing protein [Candidatus Baltobacteraceae bacterium]
MADLGRYDDASIVVFSGDLDVYRAGEVRMALEQAQDEPRLIVDMRKVHTVSAAVLTEFVRLHKHRLDRKLEPPRLVVTSPGVRRIFDITQLSKLWPFFETIEAASMP